MADTARVLSSGTDCPLLAIIEGDGEARAVAWPAVGAHLRSMVRISLNPGSATHALRHEMEAVYCIIAGEGVALDPDSGERHDLVKGSMAFVEPGTAYRFEAGGGGLEIVGGPCPPDRALFAELAT